MLTRSSEGVMRLFAKPLGPSLACSVSTPSLFVPAGCPGFVRLADGQVELRRVLIPVNDYPDPQVAIQIAERLVAILNLVEVELTVLHVSETDHMPAVQVHDGPSWRWERRRVSGETLTQILRHAEEADLIVMATSGHDDLLDVLRGSTMEQLLRDIRCPLLAVPAA